MTPEQAVAAFVTAVIAHLFGPAGALAIALGGLYALARAVQTLWRLHLAIDAKRDEDLARVLEINEKYAEAIPQLTAAVKDAINLEREHLQRARRGGPNR